MTQKENKKCFFPSNYSLAGQHSCYLDIQGKLTVDATLVISIQITFHRQMLCVASSIKNKLRNSHMTQNEAQQPFTGPERLRSAVANLTVELNLRARAKT